MQNNKIIKIETTCTKCDFTGPLIQFKKDPRMKLGIQNICLPCVRKSKKLYREENVEKIRIYNKTKRVIPPEQRKNNSERAKNKKVEFYL